MLLSIQDLKVAFRMGKGVRAEAVKGVSFNIAENTTVARAKASPRCRY
jgi:peptide/nickel transport system ATP-binding protein